MVGCLLRQFGYISLMGECFQKGIVRTKRRVCALGTHALLETQTTTLA